MLEIFGIKFFTIASCIFTIERMHALIHMCRVSHKAFSKIPTILLEDIKIFNNKIARKLPLVILIGWSLDIVRYLEFTRPEKRFEITVLTWKMKRPRGRKSLKVGNKRCKRRFLER